MKYNLMELHSTVKTASDFNIYYIP